jgi:flagellar hook assembly protein FlgD
MKEPARSRIDIYNGSGARVKAVAFGWRTGPFAWRWTGRTTSGAVLPSGRYRIVTTARDLAGNTWRSSVTVTLYRGRP